VKVGPFYVGLHFKIKDVVDPTQASNTGVIMVCLLPQMQLVLYYGSRLSTES
jgi:hypothetical protein